MFKFLGHRNFILPLAFVLGLTCPQLAQWTKSLTIPALALVMTVSIALTLFDETTSIPGAIFSAIYALYMIWLGDKHQIE